MKISTRYMCVEIVACVVLPVLEAVCNKVLATGRYLRVLIIEPADLALQALHKLSRVCERSPG